LPQNLNGGSWTTQVLDSGKVLVTGSWEEAVRLWDLSTGKQIRTFKGHAGMITAAALAL
jgi:WD40 repeat protein